jgi:catechol 2,3-dioxygenase-like lactoylglutathione lyase family enzyme
LSLQKSLEFYRDVLGLEEVFSWNPRAEYLKKVTGYVDADFHISVLRVPGSEYFLELIEYRDCEKVQVDHRTGNPGIAHVAFQVEDLESFFHFLKNKGVQSVSEPVIPSIGPNKDGKVVYMIDPDGFRVELIQTRKSFGEFSPK